MYTTPLDEDESNVDEYETFKSVIEGLRQGQGEWYAKLTSSLTEENGKSIEAVFTLGAQRKAAKESKNIEEAGGKLKLRLCNVGPFCGCFLSVSFTSSRGHLTLSMMFRKVLFLSRLQL